MRNCIMETKSQRPVDPAISAVVRALARMAAHRDHRLEIGAEPEAPPSRDPGPQTPPNSGNDP